MKKIAALAFVALLLVSAMPVLAQEAPAATPTVAPAAAPSNWVFPAGGGTVALGLGLIIFGAARGIGNIGGHAVESIARQPEAGGRIFTTMIISAALIEGATLFAIVICLLALG